MGWLLRLQSAILQGYEEQKRGRSLPLWGLLQSSQCHEVEDRGRVDELKKSKRGARGRTGEHERNNRGAEDVQQKYMR